MLQLVFAYPCRRVSVAPLPNMGVHLAVGLGVVLQAMTVVLPPLRSLLGLVPIGPGVFATVMLLAVLTWAVSEFLGHVAPAK